MKKLITLILLVMTGVTVLAQDRDIQHIVDRNPFDPDRGRVEEEIETPEEVVEEDVAPEELPVLDGTMVIGSMRVAIMSAQKDGRPVSIRVEMTGQGSDYLLYLREKSAPPKKNKSNRPPRRPRTQNDEVAELIAKKRQELEEEEEEVERLVINGEPNAKIGPYLVTKITREAVWLKGSGEPIKLEMFREGVEKSRGGTKSPPPKPKPTPKARPAVNNNSKGRPTPNPNVRNNKNNQKRNFNKRKQPPNPRAPRAKDLKERF